MNIGLLNERITFQKQTTTFDEYGNEIVAWDDYYACWATISGEGGRESVSGGQPSDHPDLAVTIRWCDKAMKITVVGFRILHRMELYDIVGIDHFSYE